MQGAIVASSVILLREILRDSDHLGALSRIRAILHLNGYVASTPDFLLHHLVINGASELLAEVFGEPGRHACSAFGVA